MDEETDLGLQALRRLASLWQIDDDRVKWTGHGSDQWKTYRFEWWPGNFTVTVLSQKSIAGQHDDAWRLVVRTAFLKDVAVENPETRRQLAYLSPGLCTEIASEGLARLG
jgi:hypothetical protein